MWCTNNYGIRWCISLKNNYEWKSSFVLVRNCLCKQLFHPYIKNWRLMWRINVFSCESYWIPSFNYHCFYWKGWNENEKHIACSWCFGMTFTTLTGLIIPLKTTISVLFICSFILFKKVWHKKFNHGNSQN